MLFSIEIRPTYSIQDTIIKEFGGRSSFFTIRAMNSVDQHTPSALPQQDHLLG